MPHFFRNLRLQTLAVLSVGLSLTACTTPKAIVISPPPVAKPQKVVAKSKPGLVPAPLVQIPLPTPKNTDGIRMPDMLGLPNEQALRKGTSPNKDADTGAVISRPPANAAPETKAPE